MPARTPSPALSENALDITGGLLGEDSDADSAQDRTSKAPLSPVNLRRGKPETHGASDSDDDLFIASALAGANRKASNLKGRSVKKGGGFQAMGLNANLLKAIARKGFSVPTPIQRKTIPLVTAGQDVVGMARTGSGKTAAFVIPMVEKLKVHSAKVGARALIMSPSRELALQTLKVVKELGRGTDLRCTLLVGGDSLEEQFKDMASNPDIIIATPGRFLHLKVEMNLDLSSIQYVVFDEADRLFEMGFAAQLHEILHSLPLSRQTLLFSATMPSSMIEFTKAGLNEPKLVRLDAEQKISPDLQSAFFSVKSADKEGALLHVLHDLIKVPIGPTENAQRIKANEAANKKKRKRGYAEGVKYNESPTEHSTIIFTATKHHVEYIGALLREAGFATSYVYGSLDQTARKMHIQDFRSGMTHVMVVTDVAARGIDIPILANVINYDFPPQPKIFVHRVGRTARAGQRGWSYNLVQESDVPYLLDLQLFLGKRLLLGREGAVVVNYGEDVTLGNLPRDRVSSNIEWVSKILEEDIDISALKDVSVKGEKLYNRTRNSASSQSAKRAKDITAAQGWMELHPLFDDDSSNMEAAREKMLARVSGFRPQETIFEIGRRGTQGVAGEVVKKRREAIEAKRKRQDNQNSTEYAGEKSGIPGEQDEDLESSSSTNSKEDRKAIFDDDYDDDGFEVTITETTPYKNAKISRDDSVYMSYKPVNINEHEDRAYGVHSGSNQPSFLTEARSAAMDLALDEGGKGFGESGARGKRWDKRHKKYVSIANDEDGSKGQRLVRSESGAKIPASLRSGRFEAWKKSNRIDRLPRVGESESKNHYTGGPASGRRWRHKADKAPKAPDKARDDFYKQRKKFDAAKEKRQGRFRDGVGRSELKEASEVRKERMAKAKRKEKSTRPSKKLKR